MKLQKQIIKHNPPETYGDCHRACIASVTGHDIETVPHFFDKDIDTHEAFGSVHTYLSKEGWFCFDVDLIVSMPKRAEVKEFLRQRLSPEAVCIVSGTLDRNGRIGHSCLYKNGVIMFDPRPMADDPNGLFPFQTEGESGTEYHYHLSILGTQHPVDVLF